MSRILKRPMFRDGGRANSKGTGIMTGIEDREEYRFGGGPTGMQPNMPEGDVKTILDYIQSGSGKVRGVRGRMYSPEEIYQSKTESYLTSPYEQARMAELMGMTQAAKQNFGLTETTPETTETPEPTPEPTPTPTPTPIPTDEIDFSDFEESVKGQSEIIEKMLTEGGKKQAVFKALTAAAPELLKEDYGAAIKAAGEELSTVEDVKKQAKLLAIQQELKLRQLKAAAEAKATGTASFQAFQELKTLYGDSVPDEELLQMAYGSVYQKREDPGDAFIDAKKTIQDSGSSFEKKNATGYAQALIERAYHQIPTVSYVQQIDEKTGKAEIGADLVKPDPNTYFTEPGQIYFDPVKEEFEVLVKEKGKLVLKITKDRDKALKLAGRK